MPFAKGQSGNPGGRPRGDLNVIANLAIEARKYSRLALGTLVEMCRKGETQALRFNAAIALLDRGYGRPTQSLDLKTDSPAVQLNFFENIALEDQRLIAESLRAIETDPSGLRNAIDLVADASLPAVAGS